MRIRTEEKRREIVEVAAQLFQEQGFDRTSMSQISQRVGGSKATLYGYFKSKEELLLAVLNVDIDEQADVLMGKLTGPSDLREGLLAFGISYLERRLAPRPIAFVRLVSSQPEESGIAEIFYRNILGAAWMRLCRRFESMIEDGRLRRADPWVMAMHWKGLLEQDLFDRRLLGAIRDCDAATIRRAAEDATEIFLRAYGPERPEAAGVPSTP